MALGYGPTVQSQFIYSQKQLLKQIIPAKAKEIVDLMFLGTKAEAQAIANRTKRPVYLSLRQPTDSTFAVVNKELLLDTKPISVVLHPYTTLSNGAVSWAPKVVNLITTPEAYRGTMEPWYEQLASHELRHVTQTQHFTKGIWRALEYVMGEQAVGIGLGLFSSSVFMEGDAVVAEAGQLRPDQRLPDVAVGVDSDVGGGAGGEPVLALRAGVAAAEAGEDPVAVEPGAGQRTGEEGEERRGGGLARRRNAAAQRGEGEVEGRRGRKAEGREEEQGK